MDIKKKIINKIKKNKAGFSLVELLFSMLILMLSTSTIIMCFNLGYGQFINVTKSSEAQLLCSSLATSLQNELSYAQQVRTFGSDIIYFSNARKMGDNCSIHVMKKRESGKWADSTDGGEIFIMKTVINDDGSKEYEIYPLVASSNYSASNRVGVSESSNDFLVAYLDLDYNTDGLFEVKLWIGDDNHTTDTNALAKSEFKVRPTGG